MPYRIIKSDRDVFYLNNLKNENHKTILLIVPVLFFSCNEQSTLEGLWVVKTVQVGEQEMTPNARWTRFNANHTQESGNGRFQHSYGTWQLDEATYSLSVTNLNGLEDSNGPFTVSIRDDKMTWTRTEEGQPVAVTLERSSTLSETYSDRLLGLWSLDSLSGEGKYFNQSNTAGTASYIFFRWDKRFVIQSENGRINGVYNVHGHKPEVELIPYGGQLDRDFWKVNYDDGYISLKLLNSNKNITRRFRRINKFLD